jgi:hypothetical protein
MFRYIIIWLFITILLSADSNSVYFVATNGNDNNSGTLQKPFKSLQMAIKVLKAGDIVNIRAGNYPIKNKISISGTREKPITIQAYRDERVAFVGSYGKDKSFDLNQNHSDNSFIVTGSWLIFRNFEIKNGANGLYIKSRASHNRFENLSLHDNYYSGLVMTDGAEYNTVVNCDSYHNFDIHTHGQHADGFVVVGRKTDPTPFVGVGNRFINCRSWGNSDDGYDCWEAGNPISFTNCLAYENGKDIWHKGEFQGDGNGFKLGVHNRFGHARDAHIVIHCKAWNNQGRGFDTNDNKVAVTFIENVSWNNGKSGYKSILTNHNLIGNIELDSGKNYIDKYSYQDNNSWNKKDYNIRKNIISFDDTSIKGKRDQSGKFITNGFLEVR